MLLVDVGSSPPKGVEPFTQILIAFSIRVVSSGLDKPHPVSLVIEDLPLTIFSDVPTSGYPHKRKIQRGVELGDVVWPRHQ